ncbi:hypothetical protein ONZ45_g17040 [Pleurotus djamor]|nr:hypothetical protein ONZ45_g17040 [Pleurotus djamor]
MSSSASEVSTTANPVDEATVPSVPAPGDSSDGLTPPIGTSYWKSIPFKWNSSISDVGNAEWNVEIYVYVSSAAPDDPQFTSKGGRITIVMVHTGYFETNHSINKGLKFIHNVVPSVSTVYREQCPPDWSGEVIGNIDDERRRYHVDFKDSLPMFNNGGNGEFVFDAHYYIEYERKDTTQGGSSMTDGLQFDVTANVKLSNPVTIPIHGLSVFKFGDTSAFPMTFSMKIGYGAWLGPKTVNIDLDFP